MVVTMKVTWNKENWTTSIALPAWKDHLSAKMRRGVPVIFNPEGADEDIKPTSAQLTAVQFLMDKQVQLIARVSRALRAHYDEMRPRMVQVAAEMPEFFPNFHKMMPERPDAATFARLHPLRAVYVQPTAAKRRAHVGLAFDAAWEVEHGVGVLTHGLNVREVGDHDTALLEWVAVADARKLSRSRKPAKAGPRRR